MPLKTFLQKFLQPFALDAQSYKKECGVPIADTAPLLQDKTSAGASISGL